MSPIAQRSMNAEPLVLLPGMGCTAALWSLVDLGSRPVLTPVLDQPSLDAQVARLLDELPGRFDLAGLSLGGIVAMALVSRAPDRVSRLTLMSTNPYAPVPDQHLAWVRQRAALADGVGVRELARTMIPGLLSPRTIADRPDLVQLTLTMAEELGEQTYDTQRQLQASRVDQRPGLASVRCPTTILSAREDQLCSVARHQELASLIPGARLTVIEHCAHLSPLEQPDAVLAGLTTWLTDAPPPAEQRMEKGSAG